MKHISQHRLLAQKVAEPEHKTAPELVSWMGAMQAQDYNMAKWAVGCRMPNATDDLIEHELSKGSIVRTHVLRPTWHIVAAEDIRWMLELTAPHLKRTMASSARYLGLEEKINSKCIKIIQKALAGHNHLTREELMAILEKQKINTTELRSIHIMFHAELEGIVINGPVRGKKQTYALMDERIPPTKKLYRQDALHELAKRYFVSHGYASIDDFRWWSGLPAADAKAALESVKHILTSETIGEKIYWFSPDIALAKTPVDTLQLLPSFDEFLISYKDRSPSLEPLHFSKAYNNNGIFWPIIVKDANVCGTWKRTIKKDTVIIEPQFFLTKYKPKKTDLLTAAKRYADFLGLKVEIR